MDDLTQEFVAETREMLEHVGNALVEWENDPNAVRDFDDVFRFVHTVKGSCGFLNLPRIEKLAHAAETVLADLRADTLKADAALVGGLLRIIDRIVLLVAALESGDVTPDEETDSVLVTALAGGVPAPILPAQTLPAQTPIASATPVQRRNVRIDIDLLDAMMTQVSDLVLVRNQLKRTLQDAIGNDAAATTLDALSSRIGELRVSIARARMQPVDRLFAALPRLVRDTGAELGKTVHLSVEGTDVELDREMIEQLRDPMIHIVRNAIDHGIETPQARRANGKSPIASLRVTARQSGNQVVITISDDGRGIDIERLRDRAIDARVKNASQLSEDAVANLIFLPGLSTATAVTAISGRGIGMDVVRANIEKLGGNVSLHNRPGVGLTIDICVPLTLSIVTVLTVTAGGMDFAVPRAIVQEVMSTKSPVVQTERFGSGEITTIRGEKLGTINLGTVLGLTATPPSHLLVVQPTGGRRYAMLVDAVHDQEEVVVRQVAPQLAVAGVYAGQALPNSGFPMLVIDVLGVARRTGLNIDRIEVVAAKPAPSEAPRLSILSFIGLNGQLWGVPTHLVERIEEVPQRAFTVRKGDAFVTLDGALCRAILGGSLPSTEEITVLRLNNGSSRVGYPVLQVEELVRVEAASIMSRDRHPVVLVDQEIIQLLDERLLFTPDLEPIEISHAA